MRNKKLLLFIVGLMIITAFFLLPRNREWAGTVLSYGNDYLQQRDHLDRESRMVRRFGNDYVFTKNIAGYFERKGIKGEALVLMPPTAYFTRMGVKYHVPEPAVFYYYTGLKTIWPNSKKAIEAGWYVRVSEGKIIVDSVTDKKKLQDTIIAFEKMGVTL